MAEKGKVLLVGPLPPPIGGDTVMTSTLLNSRYWSKRGFQVVSVNTSEGKGVRLPDSKLSFADLLRAVRIISSVLFRLPGVDIVLLYANSRFLCTAGLVVIKMAQIAGKPVMSKVFGAFLAKRISNMGSFRKGFTVSILSQCEKILPETEGLARELVQNAGIPPDRIMILPNFIPDSHFVDIGRKGESVFSARSGQGPTRAVFLGQVKKEKGIFDIIEAVDGKPQYSCDFFGPVTRSDSSRFFESIEASSNLSYRGEAEPGDVSEILKDYHVLLLPSYHPGEGHPAVILQAFAAGVPVISTDWLSIPDLIGDNERGILVPVKDPRRLEEALAKVASDPASAGKAAEASYRYVRRFSEESVIGDALMAEIDKLVQT